MKPIDLQRRALMRALSAVGMAPLLAHAEGVRAVTGFASEDEWMQSFTASRARLPWTLGFQSAPLALACDAQQIHGRFPEATEGVLYRNGPASHDLGGQRYHHWFDGDGMIQRFAIGARGVRHRASYVQTEKFKAERAASQRLVEAFGTKYVDRRPINSGDDLNVANTSVLPFNGELLALWEGGSASRLDPDSLETLGLKTWREDLQGVPFSAHPRRDQDGTLWNFGVGSGQGRLVLYQISAAGALVRAQAIAVPDVPMIHDFAITRSKLVFLLPPLVFDAERFASVSFLDAHVWRPELGMRVLIIDKNDWQQRVTLELPTGFLFHLGNAWEDPQGVIRLDYVHSDTPDPLFLSTREVMRGRYPETSVPHLSRVVLDVARARASREVLPIEAEFPRIDLSLTGERYQQVLHVTDHLPGRPGFVAIGLTNMDTGASTKYVYGPEYMVEEHILVPGKRGEDWVLGTALNLAKGRTELSCFKAQRLADGPVAVAALDYALPLGLHGMFVGA